MYRARADGGRGRCEWFARCTKIRQNASKRRIRGFRGSAYTYIYPTPQKPHHGRFNPIADDSVIRRKPRFPVRRQIPHGLPCSGCPRSNPGPVPGSCGRTPKRKNPARGGVRFQHHRNDYAGCIVLNASGIFRLSRSINRSQARRADPPRPHRRPRRVRP